MLGPLDSDAIRSSVTPGQNISGSSEPETSEPLELAHVLFMDLVAFSTWPMEEQREQLNKLQQIVRSTSQYQAFERDKQLISLPTGDGMALVFFGDPVAPVKCALEIASMLKLHPKLKLRMGLNTGPVYRVADINANLNVNGGGINVAQRIMDAGNAGHILLSQTTAEVLLQLRGWVPQLHDLGEHSVKHGVKLRFYNLCNAELGNPALPTKFQEKTRSSRWTWVAAVLIAIIVIGDKAVQRADVYLGFLSRDFWYRKFAPGPRQTRIDEIKIVSIVRSVEPESALGLNRCTHRAFMAKLLTKLAEAYPRLIVIDKFYGRIPRGVCASNNDGTTALKHTIRTISARVPLVIAVESYSRDNVQQFCPQLQPENLQPQEMVLGDAEPLNEGVPADRVSFGLAMINVDVGKVPLGWMTFPPDCNVKQERPTMLPTVATAAAELLDSNIMKSNNLTDLKGQMTHPSIKLGRPGTFESVSAIKIVCNNPGPDIDWTHCGPDEGDKAALDGLRHKVVIVGETTGDVHQTDQGVMAGPELQANYIAALLDESFLIPSPQWVNDLVIVAWLLVLLAVFYGCKLPELALVVSAVITLGLGVFFSAVIRSQWGVFAAVVPPSILEIIGLYLARRIELAIRESAHGEPKSA